jgi:hypothetical protein
MYVNHNDKYCFFFQGKVFLVDHEAGPHDLPPFSRESGGGQRLKRQAGKQPAPATFSNGTTNSSTLPQVFSIFQNFSVIYTVKKVIELHVPSRDVTNQSLPG